MWSRHLYSPNARFAADETGLTLHVHHYPPGTSKWNRIEHRLFCHITQNWRGRPLTDRVAVVELIGATTTKSGLKVECALDTRIYQKGIKVSDAEMGDLDITGDPFHPGLDHLRRDLAVRYLQENIQASQIAWRLGFHQPSAFSHACRRWTGKSPSEFGAVLR